MSNYVQQKKPVAKTGIHGGELMIETGKDLEAMVEMGQGTGIVLVEEMVIRKGQEIVMETGTETEMVKRLVMTETRISVGKRGINFSTQGEKTEGLV